MKSMPRSTRETASFERHYSPGWFDRLTDWVDRMPGPNALYCLGLLVFQFGYVTALLWFNGKLPVGSIDLRLVFMVVVAPYLIWVRFHLDRVAAAALDAFRPVLAVSDAEFLRLRYELTTLPARTTRIVTSLAIAVFFLNAVLLPGSVFWEFGSSFAAALIGIGPVGLFTVAVVAVSTFQAIHQLRMVGRVYDLVGKIALLRAKPLYAFSQLTARTGASFLLLTYYVAAVRPDLVSRSPALEALLVAMIPTAVACFVLPLRGMHRRLATEKDRALAEVASRFETVFARLHERVDQEVLTDADKFNLQITSLSAEREVLARVSTWPWEPATLTGFLTTLVLPVFLWVIQRVLERVRF
jgi:cell division protein FtsL